MISTRVTSERIFDTLHDTQRIYLSMKTNFKLRSDLTDKQGRSLIYLHASSGGKRERINTEIRVKPELWIDTKQRVKPIDKLHQDINLMLDNIEAKLANIKTVYRLSELVLTAKNLKTEFINDMPRVNFVAFMTHKIEEDRNLFQGSTYRRYSAIVNKLRDYREEIMFSEIDLDFLKKYRIHLKKIGNVDTTINSNLKGIKKYLREAQRSGIKLQIDLDDFIVGSTSGNRTFLHSDDVKKLLEHHYSGNVNGRKKLALAYFLFSCMTGLRISDIQELERNSFTGEEIAFTSIKTKKGQTITLNKTAIKLISDNEDLFIEHIERNTINRWIQDMADELEIQKHIHMHMGRHTFATNFLRAGGQIHHLQKLLGHNKIETTMVYVHILAADANKEITLLDNLYM